MSITARYRRLSPERFDALRNDPERAASYLHEDVEAAFELPRVVDIGKAWHGLHFLLTGDSQMDGKGNVPPPLGNLVQGGTETEWEATYGMVRSLTPLEVTEAARALARIDEGDLRRHFSPAAFNEASIYPHGAEWKAGDLDRLLAAFSMVHDFFLQAAAEHEVVLLSLD